MEKRDDRNGASQIELARVVLFPYSLRHKQKTRAFRSYTPGAPPSPSRQAVQDVNDEGATIKAESGSCFTGFPVLPCSPTRAPQHGPAFSSTGLCLLLFNMTVFW